MKPRVIKIFALLLIFFATALTVRAQDTGSGTTVPNTAAQANNPLANVPAFNIQNYDIGDLTEIDSRVAVLRGRQWSRAAWLADICSAEHAVFMTAAEHSAIMPA